MIFRNLTKKGGKMVEKLKKAFVLFGRLKWKDKISIALGLFVGVTLFFILPDRTGEDIFISVFVSVLACVLTMVISMAIFDFFKKN